MNARRLTASLGIALTPINALARSDVRSAPSHPPPAALSAAAQPFSDLVRLAPSSFLAAMLPMRRAVATLARAHTRTAQQQQPQLAGRRGLHVLRALWSDPTATASGSDAATAAAAGADDPDAELASVSLRDGGGLRSKGGLGGLMRQRREARQAAADQSMSGTSPGPAPPAQREWRDSRRLSALKQELAGGVHRVSRARIAEGRLADFLYWAEWKLGEAYQHEGFRCGYLVVDRNNSTKTNADSGHSVASSLLCRRHGEGLRSVGPHCNEIRDLMCICSSLIRCCACVSMCACSSMRADTVENHTFWSSSDSVSRNELNPAYSARMEELASFLSGAGAPELAVEAAADEEWNALPLLRVRGLESRIEQQALLRLQRVGLTVPHPDAPATFLPLVQRCSDIGPRTPSPGSPTGKAESPLAPVRVLYRPLVRIEDGDDGDVVTVQAAPEVWRSVAQRGPLSAPRKRRDGSEGKVTVEAVPQSEEQPNKNSDS